MDLWCRRVGEAGGWAIAVLLPLCFNPFAAAPFEPAKVTLLLAVVAAMAVARVASPTARRRGVGDPLLWPALALWIAYRLTKRAASA